jgi:hypothetical protein
MRKCRQCGPQTIDKFYRYERDGRETFSCLKCARDARDARRVANPGKDAIRAKNYRSLNLKKIKIYNKAYQKAHPEIYRDSQNKRRKAAKNACFHHYGGISPKCSCVGCDESHFEFLCLDHKDGGGNEHRAKVKMHGSNMYLWVVRNNYPPMFRILCHNCNMSLGNFGYCPHDKER